MLLNRGGEDHNVIEVKEQRLTLLIIKQSLHQPLECAWGVTKTERHAIPFKEAKWGTEGGFGPISDRDLIVPTGQVKSGKPLGAGQSIQ